MKLSEYKSYDDLPLFLNAEMVARVLGVSPSSGYELMLVVTKSAGSASACRQKLRPLPCSSSPNRTRYAGLRLGLVYHGQRVIHHQRVFPAVPIPALAEMGAP